MSLPHPIGGAAAAAPATLAPATLTLVAISLLAFAVTTLVPGAFDTLAHDDAAIAAGHVWRLASAHLLHLDLAHLAPNLIGLLLLGLALERQVGSRTTLALTGVSGLAISAGVMLDPTLARYCGLSGVLNALFAALCLLNLRQGPRLLWGPLLIAGLAKIAWESVNPPLISGDLEWPPHVLSHLVGYAMGIAFGIVQIIRSTGARAAPRLA